MSYGFQTSVTQSPKEATAENQKMQIFIYLVLILATTLSKFHEVNSEDGNTIEILFVNDMQYGFYPIDQNGKICLDGKNLYLLVHFRSTYSNV
ncbi:hypothetical protein J437_LFUL007255 [Ladona fulva]|uniref:Uncharacterized protein n=1 Tax=Ladona fulva TaxID=123851 RepID=A0A8K0NYC0_LADFU|nr:hypothetical protein J437_LFUL007255 [Ladona fulva]